MQMTATQVTVRSLTRGVEGVGHKLYMDTFFFFSLGLFNNLHTRCINFYGIVRQNRKGMPGTLTRRHSNLNGVTC
jgi:hypothetical protein